MSAIRVVVADDHAAIRAGLQMIFDSVDDIEVVGEAADGAEAIALATRLRPDVVLMDVRMPGVDGIRATQRIVSERSAEVLVLTTFDLDEYVFDALRAGAVGFLLKTVEPAALITAVRRVAAGDGVVAPEVTRALLGAFVSASPSAQAEPDRRIEALTDRERDVLDALARGYSNHRIASELFISHSTAKTHVSRVLSKLECSSRMQAAIVGRQAGFGNPVA